MSARDKEIDRLKLMLAYGRSVIIAQHALLFRSSQVINLYVNQLDGKEQDLIDDLQALDALIDGKLKMDMDYLRP